MGLRVKFTEPITHGGAVVQELTFPDAVRVVLVDSSGQVVYDCGAEVIASVDHGAAAKMERLRDANTRHGQAWTDAEAAELDQLWRAGTPMSELTRVFQRSRNAIASQAKRQGLPKSAGSE